MKWAEYLNPTERVKHGQGARLGIRRRLIGDDGQALGHVKRAIGDDGKPTWAVFSPALELLARVGDLDAAKRRLVKHAEHAA